MWCLGGGEEGGEEGGFWRKPRAPPSASPSAPRVRTARAPASPAAQGLGLGRAPRHRLRPPARPARPRRRRRARARPRRGRRRPPGPTGRPCSAPRLRDSVPDEERERERESTRGEQALLAGQDPISGTGRHALYSALFPPPSPTLSPTPPEAASPRGNRGPPFPKGKAAVTETHGRPGSATPSPRLLLARLLLPPPSDTLPRRRGDARAGCLGGCHGPRRSTSRRRGSGSSCHLGWTPARRLVRGPGRGSPGALGMARRRWPRHTWMDGLVRALRAPGAARACVGTTPPSAMSRRLSKKGERDLKRMVLHV